MHDREPRQDAEESRVLAQSLRMRSVTVFYEKTWLRFSPKQNIRLLLGPEGDLFYQQKQITFYALAAWVITGRTRTLTKNAICLGLVAALAKAEREVHELGASGATASAFVPVHMGKSFFDHAYWPIGGIATIAKASSAKRHGDILRDQARSLMPSLEMMRIIHFAYEQWHQDNRYELSVSKAATVGEEILRTSAGQSSHHLRRQWGRFSNRIALLYAAFNVRLKDGTTLLDEMLRHQPRYSHCEDHLSEWLSKARYLLKILERCPERSGDNPFTKVRSIFDANRRHLPVEISAAEFPAEHGYSDADLAFMESTFSRKRGRPPAPKL